MSQQANNIKNILSIIDDKNKIRIELPISKETQTLKRYDIISLTNLSDIFSSENTEEILINYIGFLIDIIQTRCTDDLNYIDFLHSIYALREAENSTFEELKLNKILNDIKIKESDLIKNNTHKFKNNDISYEVTYKIPTLSRLKDIHSKCEPSTKDIIFYNTFKFIDKVNISIKDSITEVSLAEDLKQLYNVISYKALDEIGSTPSDITEKLYNLYKVNIETDTRFLFSI